MKKAHPGFKAVAKSISKKEGISKSRASAILASSSRKNAGTSSNYRLKRVK